MIDQKAVRTIDLALLLSVDQAAAERCRRLQYAVELVADGRRHNEVCRAICSRFRVSWTTAWRTTSMAVDLAGK